MRHDEGFALRARLGIMTEDPGRPVPYTVRSDGIRLHVRLSPNASRDAVEGVRNGADGRPVLHLRIAAPPVDGAANSALVAFLAKALGLRKADVTIAAGATARIKQVQLAGAPADVLARLRALSSA